LRTKFSKPTFNRCELDAPEEVHASAL